MSVSKHVLRDDQESAVQLLIAEPTKAALIASDMGRGKTTVASEFVARMGLKRVLLMGIKDTFAQWADRLEAQSDGGIPLLRLDSTKAGRANYDAFLSGADGVYFAGHQFITAQDYAHVPVFNPDGSPKMNAKTGKQEKAKTHLRTFAKMRTLDLLINDEVHSAANRKSDQARTLKTIKTEWKIGMSGTPAGNSITGLWSVCRWLWPLEIDGSYYRWLDSFVTMETVYITGGKTTDRVTGEKEPGAFVKSLPLYIRAEAAEQPPAPKVVLVDLLAEQQDDYLALEKDMLVWLQSHKGIAPLVAELPITLRSRLRTATLGVMSLDEDGEIFFDLNTKSAKLHALRGVLDAPGWSGKQVAIYTDSKRFAKVVVARMQAAGYNAVEWSGDVTSKQRDEIKRQFLAGEVQFLVCVIAAFNAGLDGFQTVCNRVVWLSESENRAVNAQALARFFRPGRVGEFEHVKILANNTHDVQIYSRLLTSALAMNATLRNEKVAA